MKLEIVKLDKAINKAYFKQSLKRADIELFKSNFTQLFARINETESEEHNKNIVSDFLKNTFYKNRYEINTSGRKDLVIHKDNTSQSPVSVIIEAKSPNNKAEMISVDKPNAKALQETIHYYLQERLMHQNKEIKHLIITNIYDWFIFDAADFEKQFYANKDFRNKYLKWTDKNLVGTTTDWFYTELAKPYIETNPEALPCVHINLLNYREAAKNNDNTDDRKLINLYKILSPEHLLKFPFANDYNKIDPDFYNELLYILGLEETQKGGKTLITRVKEKNRKAGSLLENTINIIEQHRKRKGNYALENEQYDRSDTFSVALELCITWLNRILFLKLLEAQLVKFHKDDKSHFFLNTNKIKDFDELDELFFEVFALPVDKRSKTVVEQFGNLPYLNSSLFDPTDYEQEYLFINGLKDRLTLKLSKHTVLKDNAGNRLSGELNTLEYLFEFLNAYSFASDDKADIQDDSRTIINAAVLGLIFEKINGYKDGSFYTPSFITSYISRETIRKTVLDKFGEAYKKPFKDFEQLKDYIEYQDSEERRKANEIINSIKICDPAAGSGHFLVSALNELVAVKSELKILQDAEGKRIRTIKIDNINDELEIIDEETSEPFQYYVNEKGNPPSEIQNTQKAIFNEKRNLIENCIYGVDINSKSVLICRLRLWIELLKNTFYTDASNFKFLETLPNIDINIKTGNSLISKFDTGLNIFEQQAVNNIITQYKLIADQYKRTSDYEQKEQYRSQINRLKGELEKYAVPRDKYYRKYLKKKDELGKLLNVNSKNKDLIKQTSELSKEVSELENKYKANYRKVYANAMEWAIEFPEILTDTGNFRGFDIIMGNPPYFSISKDPNLKVVNENFTIFKNTADIYTLFVERGIQILKPNGRLSYITSNKWLRANYGENLRKYLLENTSIEKIIDFDGLKVFDKATVDTGIIELLNYKNGKQPVEAVRLDRTFNLEKDSIADYFEKNKIELHQLSSESWGIIPDKTIELKEKIKSNGKILQTWDILIHYGIKTGYNKAFFIDGKTKEKLIAKDPKSAEIIHPLLRGRDVHKYYVDSKDRFLINTYNGRLIEKKDPKTGKKHRVRVDRVDVENDYPAIFKYLSTFKENLTKRGDKGEHWTNHRNCAYQDLFFGEKIIYPETTVRRSEFYLDNNNYLADKTCFILTGENLKYLNGILCSKAVEYYLETELRTLGKTSIQYSKQYMEKLPIPEITKENQETAEKIETLVNEIINRKETDKEADISEQTTEIDKLVYELYDLTKEEINMIESTPKS